MKRIANEAEILSQNFKIKDKIVIDAGCGIGKVTRWIAELGGVVTGIDSPDLIEKAHEYTKVNNESYKVGYCQNLPFENEFADIIFYCASFHHIPEDKMDKAMRECVRVLKSGGKACFIEPVSVKKTYFELIKIVADETDIQTLAYQFICNAAEYGLKEECETIYFLERSYRDYENLLRIYVAEEKEREKLLNHARNILRGYNSHYYSVILPSVVRANIFLKII